MISYTRVRWQAKGQYCADALLVCYLKEHVLGTDTMG